MEYTSSRRLSCCLAVLATGFLLSSLRASAEIEISAAQQFIVPQSHYRAIYGLRPLKWSSDLADRAAQWAVQFKGNCAAPSTSGVNVFKGYGGAAWQPSDAVAAWVEQAQHYNYMSNSCAPGRDCGEYRQVVWRWSTEVGCASVSCDSGETLMTCHYEPMGNIMGQKPF